MEDKKKKRSANFTVEEVNLLCELVKKYSNVIESKKTDAVTWQMKNETWDKLTAEFNLRCNSSAPRTTFSLRSKYETFKKDLKKKAAKHKMEHFKTGGGEFEAVPFTPAEETVYNVIAVSDDGLQGRFDDDRVLPVNKEMLLKNQIRQNDIEIEYMVFEENINENTENEIDDNDDDTRIVFSGVNSLPKLKTKVEATPTPSTSQTPQKAKLSATTRQNMKRPISKQFFGNKKTNLQTKIAAAQKVNILAESKKALVELQSTYVENEIKFQEKEQSCKLRKLESEIRSAKLDVEIKELEKRIKEETLKKILKQSELF